MFLRSSIASFAVALVALTALATAAEEGAKAPAAKSDAAAFPAPGVETGAKDQGLVLPPSAPRAAQIEPMVAPVKRSAPQTPASEVKKTSSASKDTSVGKDKSAVSKPKAAQAASESNAGKSKTTSKSDECSTGQKIKGERCVKLKLADQETGTKKAKKK